MPKQAFKYGRSQLNKLAEKIRPEGVNLLERMLQFDPVVRVSARSACEACVANAGFAPAGDRCDYEALRCKLD